MGNAARLEARMKAFLEGGGGGAGSRSEQLALGCYEKPIGFRGF